MPDLKWTDEDWETLNYAIQRKNCILMLGPGAAIDVVKKQPRLLTEILAEQLAENINPETKKKINLSDLAQVSQYYCIQKGRHSLEVRVRTFFNEKSSLSSTLHRNLADIDFYFTITTTPDNMFYEALKNKGKEPIIDFYNFRGDIPVNVTMGTVENPLLYYLYGTVEEPRSLLITENDLLDFLVALISRKPSLPDNIRSELQDENKSFLFLGFGFRHWYLRILLHVLQGGRKKGSPSVAMEKFTLENPTELERIIFFFQNSDCKVHIYNDELNHFVEELQKRYVDYKKKYNGLKQGSILLQTTHQKAAKVFICHANENKEKASLLYKKIEEKGFKPWLDEENLLGGDNWDEIIRKAIEKEIDYIVVLLSYDLVKKVEGYVFKEINMALDRQDKFKRGIRFIIPVRIDNCPMPEELAHLHVIDLINMDNIKELIKTIKRDYATRGN